MCTPRYFTDQLSHADSLQFANLIHGFGRLGVKPQDIFPTHGDYLLDAERLEGVREGEELVDVISEKMKYTTQLNFGNVRQYKFRRAQRGNKNLVVTGSDIYYALQTPLTMKTITELANK